MTDSMDTPIFRDIDSVTYPPMTVYPRGTLERLTKYNPIIPNRVLVAEMVDTEDMDEVPRWKMGDGASRYTELPYCSGPPTAYTHMMAYPFFNIEEGGDHGQL